MEERGIRKKGILKKLKRGHKKFFVLREKTLSGPARLEYYDKESGFKNGNAPKRSIELQSCFNISKMSDKKNKYLIKLFTKDDCFSIVYENEEDREEWFKVLENLQNEEGDPSRPHFEHIWPVTVKQKGLGNQSITPGQYRLCLTRHTLSLVHTGNDRTYEFQLGSVRRYGHTNDFFFMEVGRSSQTGPGELWMQAEDSVIARNMHEVLRCFNERSRPENYRGRAHSTASDISHSHMGTNDGLLRSGSDASSSPRVLPIRTRSTIGTTTSNNANLSTRRRRTNSIDSQRSHGTTGSQSDQESDSSLTHLHSGSGIDGHFEESYMVMDPKDILVNNSQAKDEYEEMNPSADDEYMSMSPPAGENFFPAGTSYSSSPAISTSSSHDIEETYTIMNMSGLPPLQEGTDAGYIPMTPHGSLTLPGGISHRPDTVRSYFNDDDSNMNNQMREQRAYSLGSKQVYKNKGTTTSSGYIPMDLGNKLDKGGTKSSSAPHLVDKVTTGTQTPISSSSRSSSRATDIDSAFMEMDFNTKNSEPRPRTSSGGRDLRPRTGSFGQEFMRKRASSFGKEANMSKPSRQDGSRYRTTTICQDQFRTRTSSFGNDFRPRSYSDTRHFRHTEGGRHSTSDSLRRHAARTSQESVSSHKMSNEYIDMSKPAPVPEHAVVKDGVYANMSNMSPSGSQDAYMEMTPGAGRSPSRSNEKSRRPPSRSGSSAGKTPMATHIKVPAAPEKRSSPDPMFSGEYIDVDFSSSAKKTSASSSRSVSPAVKSCSPAGLAASSVSPTAKSPSEGMSLTIEDSYAIYKPGGESVSPQGGSRSGVSAEGQLEMIFSGIRVSEEEEPATPTNIAPVKPLPAPTAKHQEVKKVAPPLPPMPVRHATPTPPRDSISRSSPGRVLQPVPLPPTSVNSSPLPPPSQPIPIPLSPNLPHQGVASAAIFDSLQLKPDNINSKKHDAPGELSAKGSDSKESTPQSVSPASYGDSPHSHVVPFPEIEAGERRTPTPETPPIYVDMKPPPAQFPPLNPQLHVVPPQQPTLKSNPRSASQLAPKGHENYMNMGMPRNASEASMSSLKADDQLHYASLDLGSSNEFIGSAECVAVPTPHPSTSTNSDSEDDDDCINYSEVDFEKSETLRLSSKIQKTRETQVPFEL